MEPLCDFCRGVRAVVYCKSDSARLCLRCDGCVHSANLLSCRHARSLLCEKCNCQSAVLRCLDEKLSLCQDCDWNCSGCSSLGHRREPLNCYTGVPSLAEFRRIWSSVLDAGVPVGSALPGNDDCIANCSNRSDLGGSFGLDGTKLNELKSSPRPKPWIESSRLISTNANCMPYCGDQDQQPLFSEALNMPKGYSELKDFKVPNGDDLCEGLNMNDFQLNSESVDEIPVCSPGQTGYQFENVGTDCILMENTLSVTKSDGHIENTIEASSSGQKECMPFPSPQVGGFASLMASITGNSNCMLMNPGCNINLGYPENHHGNQIWKLVVHKQGTKRR